MAASMSPILALSVTHKIEQYGAYAGFASVLGLAVLSLLYFAQAREVKRLREWAGRAPERAAEVADVQRRAQPVAAQPPQPARPAAAPVPAAAAPAPATPAGQAQQPGAPAAPAAPGVGVPATVAAAAAGAASAQAASQSAASQPTTVQPAAGGGTPAGNGVPNAAPARPGQPLRVPPGAGAQPGARPAAGSVSARSLGAPPASEGRSRGTILAIAGAVAAVVVVVLVLVFVVLNGGGSSGGTHKAGGSTTAVQPQGGSDGTSTDGRATASPVSPGSFTTSVLNGTTVTGLAQGVATRLENAHFTVGTITNALDQSRSQTLVEYTPGHRAQGLLVAKAIDVKSDAVQVASAGSRTIAGQQAAVIVTVGADQNQSPQQ